MKLAATLMNYLESSVNVLGPEKYLLVDLFRVTYHNLLMSNLENHLELLADLKCMMKRG